MVEALTGAANCLDSADEVIEHVHHEYEEDIRHISPSDTVEYASAQNRRLMEIRLATVPIKTDHLPLVEVERLQKCETVPKEDMLRIYPLRHAKLASIKLITVHFLDCCTCHQYGKNMLRQLAQEGWELCRGHVPLRLNSKINTMCVLCNDDLLVHRVVLGSGSSPEWPVSADLVLAEDQKPPANVWIWEEQMPRSVQGVPFWYMRTKKGMWGWLTLVSAVNLRYQGNIRSVRPSVGNSSRFDHCSDGNEKLQAVSSRE